MWTLHDISAARVMVISHRITLPVEMITPASFEDVTAWLDACVSALGPETVEIPEAVGRVLAAPVDAAADHPPSAVAVVDGFALRAERTVGASEYNPLAFRLDAGDAPELGAGQARAVISGEPLPPGADTVLPLLDVELRGEALDVFAPLAAGTNVIPAGREARTGDRLVDQGRLLRPADAALLMETGIAKVPVVRRPRVTVILVRCTPRDTTGPMIRALVERDGGVCAGPPPRASDASLETLSGTLSDADADLLIVAGGSGFGRNDPGAGALSKAGELVFRGVAINPGETSIVGRVGRVPVLVLPGAPLASLFGYDALAGRVVRRLGGRKPGWPYGTRRAALTRKIASGLGRLEYCRVRLDGDRADPLAVADGRTLSTAVRADGFVLVPSSSEGFAAGSEVTVHLYDQRF